MLKSIKKQWFYTWITKKLRKQFEEFDRVLGYGRAIQGDGSAEGWGVES